MITAAYVVGVDAKAHQLSVELRLDGVDPTRALNLATPTWVPGAYGFMKYGRDVFEVRAADGAGNPLGIERQGWAGYTVAKPTSSVIVRHRSFAYDTAWGELAGIVDHEYAVLLASRMLHAVEHRGPVSVTYQVPAGWQLHHPGQTGGGTRYEYPSYQKLLDTPVVAGAFDLRTREIDGVRFHHVFLDKTLGFDSKAEDFIDRLMKVTRACGALFGAFPFREYTWIFSFSPETHWGLEHSDATMISLEEDTFIDVDDRNKGLRVCAHELLHAWNVCRLKPAPLENADLVAGSFPDALWVAEGFTRYYEFLLGVRSGEAAPETFLSNVVNYFRTMASHPGYERVSALDSSRSSFLNHNRYPGSANNTIDYYDKGMLIAFDVDATLRLTGRTDLDRELRAFYDTAAGQGDGYSSAQIQSFLLGRNPELESVLPREVDQAGGLSTRSLVEKLGFDVATESVPKLGMILDANRGPKVANIIDTLPAGNLGLAPGDDIDRVDGFPYSLKRLQWAIKHQSQVALTVTRGLRSLTFRIPVGSQEEISKVTWKGTTTQLSLLRTWIGQPGFTLATGEAISLKSHENFHTIQTVV